MVKNIILKIIILMVIFQTTFIPVSNASYWDEIINGGDKFLKEGAENQIVKEYVDDGKGNITEKDLYKDGKPVYILNKDEMKEAVNRIYSVLFILGVALSVIIGAVTGIKFMTGSAEEQARIKEMIMPYIVGCIVVFGSFGIWKIIIELGTKVFD